MADETDPKTVIEEEIGGVQGADDRDTDGAKPHDGADAADRPGDVPPPEAGEIEWAGGLVKKAPRSAP